MFWEGPLCQSGSQQGTGGALKRGYLRTVECEDSAQVWEGLRLRVIHPWTSKSGQLVTLLGPIGQGLGWCYRSHLNKCQIHGNGAN